MKKAIVLAIDGLGAGAIGPFGGTHGPTPALNRFASQSLLVEHAIADTRYLSGLYDVLLKGGHGAYASSFFENRRSLPQLLRSQDIASAYIADTESTRHLDVVDDFDQRFEIELASSKGLVEEPEESWMATFFSETLQAIDSCRDSSLFWIHCPGLNRDWDAPFEFRSRFVDDEDPEPPRDVKPASLVLDEHYDPDMVHGIVCSYAGQVMQLDMMIDAFLQNIDHLLEDSLVIIFGLRGYPLGEHRVIGLESTPIQAELIQVPLMVRTPKTRSEACRYQGLVQFADICATLNNWFGVEQCSAQKCHDLANLSMANLQDRRTFAISAADNALTLRTDYWCAVTQLTPAERDDQRTHLYLKPDDRWNANDIADLCPEILEDLQSLRSSFESALDAGDLEGIDLPTSLLTTGE